MMQHVAARTSRIRVGAGGIMLPNHSPLVVAEQFGMLEALYPGRIDLGLGRAPGTDMPTVRALRRTGREGASSGPQERLDHARGSRAGYHAKAHRGRHLSGGAHVRALGVGRALPGRHPMPLSRRYCARARPAG